MHREADDFRFGLARHWTLYDAMMHSAFVAVRMQTWHDKGRRQLEELLAKMGFKLKECKQDSGRAARDEHWLQALKRAYPCVEHWRQTPDFPIGNERLP